MKHIESNPSNSYQVERDGDELIRLVVAAVISEEFRRELLTNPEQALTAGYNGVPFKLAEAERRAVLSIQTTSLTDFAAHLVNGQNGNSVHHQNGTHKNGFYTGALRFPFSADSS
jgi:hypothetical protein